MVEQKRLENLANNVGDNLQYYGFLEPITRKLNAPGAGNFVRGKEFSDMLARLDECLEYMNSHVWNIVSRVQARADSHSNPNARLRHTGHVIGYF